MRRARRRARRLSGLVKCRTHVLGGAGVKGRALLGRGGLDPGVEHQWHAERYGCTQQRGGSGHKDTETMRQ